MTGLAKVFPRKKQTKKTETFCVSGLCCWIKAQELTYGIYCSLLKDFPARFVWLEVVSFDLSLLKGEAPRFSADFTHHLSFKLALKAPPPTLYRAWKFF
jgi:hypothetical protein